MKQDACNLKGLYWKAFEKLIDEVYDMTYTFKANTLLIIEIPFSKLRWFLKISILFSGWGQKYQRRPRLHKPKHVTTCQQPWHAQASSSHPTHAVRGAVCAHSYSEDPRPRGVLTNNCFWTTMKNFLLFMLIGFVTVSETCYNQRIKRDDLFQLRDRLAPLLSSTSQ